MFYFWDVLMSLYKILTGYPFRLKFLYGKSISSIVQGTKNIDSIFMTSLVSKSIGELKISPRPKVKIQCH